MGINLDFSPLIGLYRGLTLYILNSILRNPSTILKIITNAQKQNRLSLSLRSEQKHDGYLFSGSFLGYWGESRLGRLFLHLTHLLHKS